MMRQRLDDEQIARAGIVDLTIAIRLMTTDNRMAIRCRKTPQAVLADARRH